MSDPLALCGLHHVSAVGAGTGLGLDTARRIVEDRHGGSLWVDSRPGETVFHVRLPITAAT